MTRLNLHNESSTVGIDPLGGAIVSFTLNKTNLNPLNFRLRKTEELNSTYYQGHFICLPRWGDPTIGEQKKGLIKHGNFSELNWSIDQHSSLFAEGKVISEEEEIALRRFMFLDDQSPVLHVTETVKNISSFLRMVNFVQHPSIAPPFLSADTIVNCNGSMGFTNLRDKVDSFPYSTWPLAFNTQNSTCDLRSPREDCSGVYSFVVSEGEEYGWITAFSPANNLLIGYIWKRTDYPWINCWLHYDSGEIVYRGLEFGTTGIHKPIDEIVSEGKSELFDEKTFLLLDADEQKTFAYTSFLIEPCSNFTGMDSVNITNDGIIWKQSGDTAEHLLKTTLTKYYDLGK